MTTVLLIIHLFVTLALIGVVLLQRSEGGGLGIGSSQGMGAFMTGRGTANLLTRATAVLAAAFFVLSLTLAYLSRGTGQPRSILDTPAMNTPAAPSAPAAPAAPLPPAVPTN
jgi:preprotein translocase subunit SecG